MNAALSGGPDCRPRAFAGRPEPNRVAAASEAKTTQGMNFIEGIQLADWRPDSFTETATAAGQGYRRKANGTSKQPLSQLLYQKYT